MEADTLLSRLDPPWLDQARLLDLWWTPLGARLFYTQIPSAHTLFQCRFFLWAYRLLCSNCRRQLTGAGLYRTIRCVLDHLGWYFMGREYLECGWFCKRKYAAWAQDIVSQLDMAHQQWRSQGVAGGSHGHPP
ncbi:unnamed protein product [Pleuronectes platessa]|uniref:DUF6729 domain-containing protein n=1 Tax=Pleuronectes platessa TaxID=8262 RepID=A0A9N7YSF2_PLEPL|nr:unnamed protein product [Pleuronectes platessa]